MKLQSLQINGIKVMERCWCENSSLEPYSENYKLCRVCETLVTNVDVHKSALDVKNDEQDFYGKNYWLEASNEFPDIFERSRNDLSERNIHWLKYLLKYKLPPARVLEVGCAHGSFLALLKHIGFDVTGIEMSPWVIEYAKNIFNVDVRVGPIEKSGLSKTDKFDVIAMMDVLEHLLDPVETIENCLEHLTDEGIFLIQMPCFPSHLDASHVIGGRHDFEKMMLPNEHLYLFSEKSAKQFFNNLGCSFVEFIPAIFNHYDMFLVASRTRIDVFSDEIIGQNLSTSLNGRLVQALLDLREREQHYLTHFLEKKKNINVRLVQALLDLRDREQFSLKNRNTIKRIKSIIFRSIQYFR